MDGAKVCEKINNGTRNTSGELLNGALEILKATTHTAASMAHSMHNSELVRWPVPVGQNKELVSHDWSVLFNTNELRLMFSIRRE